MSSLPRNMSNIYPRNYFSLTEDDNSIITMPDDDMIAQLPLLAEVCTDISEPYCLPTDSPANADDWDFAGLRNITTSNYAGLNFTVQTPSFPRNMPYCLPTDSPANADDWDFAGLRNITTSNYAGLNFTVQTPSFPRNMSNICPKNYFSLTEVMSDAAMIAPRPLRKEVCTLKNEPYFLRRVSLAYKEHFSGLCNNITLDHTGLDRTSRLDYTTNLGNMTCLLPMFSTRNAENGEFSRIYKITTLNYAEQNMTGSSECPRNYPLWNMTEVCPANEFIEEDKKRKSGFAYITKRTWNTATETNDHDSYFLWMFLIIASVLIIIKIMFKSLTFFFNMQEMSQRQTIIQRGLHKITSKRSGRNKVSSL